MSRFHSNCFSSPINDPFHVLNPIQIQLYSVVLSSQSLTWYKSPVFIFHNLNNFFEEYWPFLLQNALSIGVCLIFSYIDLIHFGEKYHTRDILPFSLHPIRRQMKSVCPITAGVKFNHLLKVVSARFFYCTLLLHNTLEIHPCCYTYQQFVFCFFLPTIVWKDHRVFTYL